jgi:uridine kinase
VIKKGVHPFLVAIVGGSGAGKSWLAARLEGAFPKNATRLSLDEFYLDRSHLSPVSRAKLNYDHPRAIDWPSVEAVLRNLISGTPARVPRYDFKTHCRLGEETLLEPKPLILIEGLWLLRRPSLRRLFGLRIFIECSRRTRLARRLDRDQAARGRTMESVKEQFQTTVEPMHVRFVEPQKRWADIVLPDNFGRHEVNGVMKRIAEALCWGGPRSARAKARKSENSSPI